MASEKFEEWKFVKERWQRNARFSCNIKNVRLSDSNSRLSIAKQALCPLSHCRAAY